MKTRPSQGSGEAISDDEEGVQNSKSKKQSLRKKSSTKGVNF